MCIFYSTYTIEMKLRVLHRVLNARRVLRIVFEVLYKAQRKKR